MSRWGPARLALVALATACGETAGPATPAATIDLTFTALDPLPPGAGTLETWVEDGAGQRSSAGRFTVPATGTVTVTSPLADPTAIMITVEPPGDDDATPSNVELMGGSFDRGTATLRIERFITGVDDLEPYPGHHALFTPSNNAEAGFPSREDAGIWVFAPIPSATQHNNHFLRLTPLRAGWIYEGWIIHAYDSPDACWISYGKFLPDGFRVVGVRDDTGLGPFSGQLDYVDALPFEVDMPGDDWVDNIHGHDVPCGLTLPFDLNGDASRGIPSAWTHAITIEPTFDRGENPTAERPFIIRPYRNPIGEGPPNAGRPIEFYPDRVPGGTAVLRR